MMRGFYVAMAVGSCFAAVPVAAADFLGTTLTAQYAFPNADTPFSDAETFVVTDPGVELTTFPNGDPRTNIDFTANSILITYLSSSTWTNSAYNGFFVRDLTNNLSSISSVTIDPNSNFAGFNASRLTFDDNSIGVNWAGLSFTPETTLRLNVGFINSAVPEPTTWMLMLMGMAGIGYSMRRKRDTAVRVRYA